LFRKRRLSAFICLLLVFSLFSGVVSADAVEGTTDPAVYEYELVSDVMVEMRDGTNLATDLYLPKAKTDEERTNGFPTLVMRTPYTKEYFGRLEAPFFSQHGYAVVVQDTRGRYKSEGVWNSINDDANDGYDTIEWAAPQDWSTGKVGTYGLSYNAYTQYQLAFSKPPSLVTMIPLLPLMQRLNLEMLLYS
jgi:putative CocE/NonD family hydrolase